MENMPLNKLQELALMGNSEAIITLSKYYYERKQFSLAFETISRFHKIEDKDGYRELAKYYEKGIGTSIDLNRASEYYIKAFNLGDYISGYILGVKYFKDKDYFASIKYLTLGVYNDFVPSIKMVANMYLNGLGVNKNTDIALNLFKKLVDLGEKQYLDQIGKIYYQRKEYFKAVEYFKLGVEIFDVDAFYHLGICYAKGQGVALDNQKAVYYYQLGEKYNHPKCIFNLAFHYENGIGVNKDIKKAKELLTKYDKISKLSNK